MKQLSAAAINRTLAIACDPRYNAMRLTISLAKLPGDVFAAPFLERKIEAEGDGNAELGNNPK